MLDVTCIGQAVIDCITRNRETTPYKPNVYRARTIELHTGGDAINEAIALSKLGYQVNVICALGNDIAGNVILNELNRHHVSTSSILQTNIQTPIANLLVNEDGSRVSINSNATKLENASLIDIHLEPSKVVSFASLFRPPLVDYEVIKHFLMAAKANGSIICTDTKLPLSNDIYFDMYKDLYSYIDYFFPNENEAIYYSQKHTYEEMASFFQSYGIKNVILKLGDKGCYVKGLQEEFLIPAIPVSNIKDTTGAGDNFVAGFISGLLTKSTLYDCALKGIQQAAKAISYTGGSN